MKTLVASILLSLLAVPAPAGEEVLELYDVRDLVAAGTTLEALVKSAAEVVGEDGSVEAVADGTLAVRAAPGLQDRVRKALRTRRELLGKVLRVHSVEDLVSAGREIDRIVELVRAEVGGEALQDLVPRDGKLVVVASAAAQEGVARALVRLRATLPSLVQIEARFVTGDGGDRGVRFLNGDEVKAYLAGIEVAEDVTILSAPSVVCENGQRATIRVGTEQAVVADMETEFTEDGGMVADPVIEKVFEGLAISLRPIHSRDGKFVTVLVDACRTVIAEDRPVRDERRPDGGVVATVIPEVKETRLRTSVTMKEGQGALLDLGADPADPEGRPLRCLLIARELRRD